MCERTTHEDYASKKKNKTKKIEEFCKIKNVV